jgi:hypothetical protein
MPTRREKERHVSQPSRWRDAPPGSGISGARRAVRRQSVPDGGGTMPVAASARASQFRSSNDLALKDPKIAGGVGFVAFVGFPTEEIWRRSFLKVKVYAGV